MRRFFTLHFLALIPIVLVFSLLSTISPLMYITRHEAIAQMNTIMQLQHTAITSSLANSSKNMAFGNPEMDNIVNLQNDNNSNRNSVFNGSNYYSSLNENHENRSIPYVGLNGITITPQLSKVLGLKVPGILVTNVDPKTPAGKADVHGGGNRFATVNGTRIKLGGDILLKADDKNLTTQQDLIVYIQTDKHIGDNLKLTVLRDSHIKEINVKLGARPGFSGGLSIQYPSDWKKIEAEKSFLLTPPLGVLSLNIESSPTGSENLQDIVAEEVNGHKSDMGFHLISYNTTTLAGSSAYNTTYDYINPNSGKHSKAMQLFIIKGDKLYKILYSGDVEKYFFT